MTCPPWRCAAPRPRARPRSPIDPSPAPLLPSAAVSAAAPLHPPCRKQHARSCSRFFRRPAPSLSSDAACSRTAHPFLWPPRPVPLVARSIACSRCRFCSRPFPSLSSDAASRARAAVSTALVQSFLSPSCPVPLFGRIVRAVVSVAAPPLAGSHFCRRPAPSPSSDAASRARAAVSVLARSLPSRRTLHRALALPFLPPRRTKRAPSFSRFCRRPVQSLSSDASCALSSLSPPRLEPHVFRRPVPSPSSRCHFCPPPPLLSKSMNKSALWLGPSLRTHRARCRLCRRPASVRLG
jgi:hypothetical protein